MTKTPAPRRMVASRLRFASGGGPNLAGFPAFLGALSGGSTSFELVSDRGDVSLVAVCRASTGGGSGGLLGATWAGMVEPAQPVRLKTPFLGAELFPLLPDWLPLAPHKMADFDFFTAAVRRLASSEDVSATVQLVVTPFNDDGWRSRAAYQAAALTEPETNVGTVIQSLIFGSSGRAPDPPRWLRAAQEAAVGKSAAPTLLLTNLRFAAYGSNRQAAARLLSDLVDLLPASYSSGHNNFAPKALPTQEQFMTVFNSRRLVGSFVTAPEELAPLWHAPSSALEGFPGLWQSATLVRSPRLARMGDVRLGHDPAGHTVALQSADWSATLLIGGSGGGKSTLGVHLALGAIARREAMLWIEPKAAETVDAILERLSEEDSRRLVVIDPTREPLVAFNALRRQPGVPGSQVAEGMVPAMTSGGPEMGHRSLRLLNLAVAAVYDGLPESTLPDVHEFLVNPAFRARVLAALPPGDFAGSFWRDEFAPLSPGQRGQWVEPVLHRLSPFLADATVRRFVSAAPGIDLKQLTANGAIITANFSGTLGQNALVLANLLLASVARMALSRAQEPVDSRPRLNLFVDEVHLVNAGLSRLLSLMRAFNVNITVAGQFFHQLPEQVIDALLANSTNLVAFRLGERDARLLAERFGPEFRVADLTALDNYQAAVRLGVGGQVSRPFTLLTEPLPSGRGRGWADHIRAQALERHAIVPRPSSAPSAALTEASVVAVEWDVG